MKTRYKLKSLRGLCMLLFACLFITTNIQAQSNAILHNISSCDDYEWINGVTYSTTTANPVPHVDPSNGQVYILNFTNITADALDTSVTIDRCETYTVVGDQSAVNSNDSTYTLAACQTAFLINSNQNANYVSFIDKLP